jgi:hypothetical protein
VVSGLSLWHLLFALSLVLIAAPIIGIPVSLARRREAIARGDIPRDGGALNGMAVIGFILAFAFAPAGIILGHFALLQIKRTNERGAAFAIAALWVGYWLVAVAVLNISVALVTLIVNALRGFGG